MIYFNGIESIIESTYLREPLGENIKESGIFVNPENITYLTGKSVIITNPLYPVTAIQILLKHRNTVISRVALDIGGEDKIIYNPYIVRPEWGMIWNGEVIREQINTTGELSDHVTFSPEYLTCYFPKLLKTTIPLIDERGNLTGIGWALHQVGLEISPMSAFQDLDVLKTKKMQI